jgi:tRNA1(Val) A37 N6-methylase TrmN6
MAAHILGKEGLDGWLRTAVSLLKPDGCLTVIHRADRLDKLLAGLARRFGSVDVLPIHPRADRPAHRVLVRAAKGSRAGLNLLPPLVLHGLTGNAFLPPVEAILRQGAGLAEAHPPWQALRSGPS